MIYHIKSGGKNQEGNEKKSLSVGKQKRRRLDAVREIHHLVAALMISSATSRIDLRLFMLYC